MIPFQGFGFEKQERKRREHQQRDDLLDHLQLHQRERPAVFPEADAVGRHHQAVLEKGDQPTDQDQPEQAGFFKEFQVLEFQVPVPGDRHEDVGEEEEENGGDTLHGGLGSHRI